LTGEKPTPEEKAKAEPVRRALNQATAQVDSPEKASRVAERLEELAGSATTGEVEQAKQPEKPATISDKVAESSRRIEQATISAPPGEKAANGIAQAAKEITASPGRERAALAEATQATFNPDQLGLPGDLHPKQREYLRQAVLKRMKPLDALDAELFLAVNHLPHNRWLNGFFRFFTFTFSAGLGWYVLMMRAILVDQRKGIRALRHTILPLSIASILVEYPIKAFFRRSRPFIDFIQAIVIGKKPGSWSFPSGHSATSFAGAWLLSRDYPRQRPFFFLLATLVSFSRIYLGDHYPGDVVSGALSGMTIAEIVRRVQRVVVRGVGSDIG
jgi:undecaprenyl-diphosphatase